MKNKYKIISMFLIMILACGVCIPCWQVNTTSNRNVGEISYSEISEKNIEINKTGVSFVNNEMMIVAKEGVKKKDVEKLAQSYDCKVVGCIEFTNDYQWRFNSVYSYEKLKDLEKKLNKEDIIEDATIKTITEINNADFIPPNDTEWLNWWDEQGGDNWGVEKINAHLAWDKKDKMKPIRIGLIDETYEEHKDLQGTFAEVVRDPFYLKTTVHGNHVAGIMAAEHNNNEGIAGVYPWGKGPDGKPYVYATTASGIGETGYGKSELYIWKVTLMELISRDVKVINISSAFILNQFLCVYEETKEEYQAICKKESQLMGDFLQKLLDKGYDFVITQAAGNSKENSFRKLTTGEWICVSFGQANNKPYEVSIWGMNIEGMANWSHYFASIENPAVKDRIVIVGALEYNNNGANIAADYSNTGSRVDVMAPGDAILSCGLKNSYVAKSGTSMAAPHVAGAAACIWSYNTKLTGAQVKEILVNTTKGDSQKVNGGDAGFIDVNLALESMENDISAEIPTNKDSSPVVGEVCNHDRQINVEGAKISFYHSESGEEIATTTTDEVGVFSTQLPTGKYKAIVSKLYYQPKTIENIVVESQKTTYMGLINVLEQDMPADTVLVLDISKSMSGSARDKMVKIAREYCKQVTRNDIEERVAVIAFTEDAAYYTDFSKDINELNQSLSLLEKGNLTNMCAGLEFADKLHKAQDRDGVDKNIIIMSDNLPNTGGVSDSGLMEGEGYYIPYDNAVLDIATKMMGKYSFYSIGFTESLEGEALENSLKLTKKLTNVRNGYFYADETTSVEKIYQDLMKAMD